MASTMPSDMSADVVVVGAGPGGSSTAYHLARAGLDVILLEKQELGRDKVCGDGLTPSAVRELVSMGMDTTGWQRNRGLRVIGGGHLLHFPWPEQASFPSYGMARPRALLDRDLADRRIFPAIDPVASGTRNEDLLVDEQMRPFVFGLRRILAGMNNTERAAASFIKGLKGTNTNQEFLVRSAKKHSDYEQTF